MDSCRSDASLSEVPMRHAVTVAAVVLMSSAAHADCASDAKNLLASRDCGFANGVAGWDAGGSEARVSHAAGDGDPKPGSLEVMAPDGSLLVSGPCIAVQPGAAYRFGARFRQVSGETYVCGPQVHHFSDAACAEPLGPLAAMGDLVAPKWQAFDPARRPENGPDQGIAKTEAASRAVRLVFACSGAPGFVVRFDDVFVSGP
jgi:hypothetical protein